MPTEVLKPNIIDEDNTKSLNGNMRQQILNNKFGMATDKQAHSLRRDLLLSNFDRNLTVEKARFEPTEETIGAQPALVASSTDAPKVDVDMNEDVIKTLNNTEVGDSPSKEMNCTPTISPSVPNLNTSSNGTVLANAALLSGNHSMSDRRRLNQARSEGNLNSSTGRKKHNSKKQTKPIMHGNASPAEVFHRNLVDAVSNVEDSDENEHYVYPFSGNETSTHHLSDLTGSGIHRPVSVRSTSASHDSKRMNGNKGLGEWLKQALYNRNSQHHPINLDDEEEEWSDSDYSRRPRLRNNINDRPSHQKSNQSGILRRWHDSFNKSVSSDKNSSKRSRRTYPPIQTPAMQQTYYYGGTNGGINGAGGYTSDEEDAPLLMRRQKRIPRSKKNCKNICRNSILAIFVSMVILLMIIIHKAEPLVDLTVDIGRVLATDKELIFDLKVKAKNRNWWTIHVADADISVFAFSQIVPSIMIANSDRNVTHIKGVDPAEYLGSLVHFDEPLSIQSSLFNEIPTEAISQIRIKSPGADTSGNERWSRMIRYPYGLVVRGVLKYRPIPFILGIYPQSVAICNVNQVDPTTGAVSTDPDKTICSSENEVNVFSRS